MLALASSLDRVDGLVSQRGAQGLPASQEATGAFALQIPLGLPPALPMTPASLQPSRREERSIPRHVVSHGPTLQAFHHALTQGPPFVRMHGCHFSANKRTAL